MSVLSAPQKANPRGTLKASDGTLLPKDAGRQPAAIERACRGQLVRALQQIRSGSILLRDREGSYACGTATSGDPLDATIRVHDPRLYTMMAYGGSLAAADAYLRGFWECDDLMTAMRILARQDNLLSSIERGTVRLTHRLRSVANWFRRNTRRGSRRNIAAHYDLSNDFFALMLDPTMTYSSGLFTSASSTLEEASRAKYDRICGKLDLSADDHVLEIGCGWGGFATHAAAEYGCRVTATTISEQQFRYAQHRVDAAGLGDRVNLLLVDYRDLRGQYDKLVSIEMIEAVGERFLGTYFGQCDRLLKNDGQMMLQAIIMPDHRYDRYRRSVDFIQRYIFPGGFLPSLSAITDALRTKTLMRVADLQDFGLDYAETLALWRENFWNQIETVRELGFDDHFIRMWHYYLCFCEAGFRENQVGVCQLLMVKPASRPQAFAR